MKVIVNRRFGSFSISERAMQMLAKKKGWFYTELIDPRYPESNPHILVSKTPITSIEEWDNAPEGEVITSHCTNLRTDSDLISVVESLGPAANTLFSRLEVIEIPNDVNWHIVEYDGRERIAEDHRTW